MNWKITFCLFTLTIFLCACNDQKSSDEILFHAQALAEKGRWDDVQKITHESLKKNGDEPRLLIMLALAESAINHTPEAITTAEKACQLAPEEFHCNSIAGKLLVEDQQYNKGIPYLLKARMIQPKAEFIAILLARAYIKTERIDDAGKLLVEMQKTMPKINKDFELYNELGVLLVKKKIYPNAIRQFELALRRSQHPIVILNIARTYDYYLKNKDKAIEYYRKILIEIRNMPHLNSLKIEAQDRIKMLQAR